MKGEKKTAKIRKLKNEIFGNVKIFPISKVKTNRRKVKMLRN